MMRKLIVLLLFFPSFVAFSSTNLNDECMFRADLLRVTIEMFQGGLTQEQTKQQIWSQMKEQPIYKDRADKWINKLLNSVYRDQNSSLANAKQNFDVFYQNCAKNFPQYGGNNALLNLP